MSCRHYRKLIALYRPGELSPPEREDLANHLRSCPACANEYRQADTAERVLQRLRTSPPELDEPDAVVESILAAVRNTPQVTARPRRRTRVRDLVWKPAFSFATAGTAVAIVMLYIVQQVSLLRDVDALERKMKQAAGNPATVEVTYALRSDAARQNSDLRQLEERALPHLVVRANGLVTIRRSTLERYAGGERSGLADTFRLCAMFGGDAQRMASLARYLQHHLTTTLLYSPGG